MAARGFADSGCARRRPMARQLMTLPCPTCQNAESCAQEGECYLARCANPHAPKPISDDELLAQFAELVLKVNAARFES